MMKAFQVMPDSLESAIIIGLVSDTHGLVRDGLFQALAGVSHILHAGDVGGRDVLDALSAIAPVEAVYGNVDPLDGRLPQHVHLDRGGLSIHVYGHTHRALVYRDGARLVVNPGAAGPARFDVKPSVAILRIENGTPEVEIVALEAGASRSGLQG